MRIGFDVTGTTLVAMEAEVTRRLGVLLGVPVAQLGDQVETMHCEVVQESVVAGSGGKPAVVTWRCHVEAITLNPKVVP